jgi:hypothetical protein
MTPLEAKLTDALLANAKLREEAERLIAAYVELDFDRPAIINELIALFDDRQREAQKTGGRSIERGWREHRLTGCKRCAARRALQRREGVR